jgi:transposase, IS5 family
VPSSHGRAVQEPRTLSAKRLAHKISKMALRGTQEEAKATYQAAYQRLVEVARYSIKQAERVRSMLEDLPSAPKISEEISHFAGLLKRAVWQTHRRVFEGEQVSAGQKLLSIFEEHTAIRYAGARHARSKPSLVGRCGSLRWMGAS